MLLSDARQWEDVELVAVHHGQVGVDRDRDAAGVKADDVQLAVADPHHAVLSLGALIVARLLREREGVEFLGAVAQRAVSAPRGDSDVALWRISADGDIGNLNLRSMGENSTVDVTGNVVAESRFLGLFSAEARRTRGAPHTPGAHVSR